MAELRFSQVSGTTIHKAINNARLNEVQRRLRRGENVSGIVTAMHFASAKQLYQMYRRHFGHTTRQAAAGEIPTAALASQGLSPTGFTR